MSHKKFNLFYGKCDKIKFIWSGLYWQREHYKLFRFIFLRDTDQYQ